MSIFGKDAGGVDVDLTRNLHGRLHHQRRPIQLLYSLPKLVAAPYSISLSLSSAHALVAQPQSSTMATTGLAASAATKFDAVTPPKPSSLPADLVNQLLVNLDEDIKALKSKKEFDLEGLMEFQRVANYL